MNSIFCEPKTILKSFLIILCNGLIAVAVGIVLLFGAYQLPLEHIDENVRESVEVLEEEGTYPVLYSWCQSQLDNWTDSIMLLEAADDTDCGTMEKAMLCYRGVIDENPCDTLVSHYISGTPYTEKASYSRYWHGYQIILKPLLEVMSYSGIRTLNFMVQILLVVVICLLLVKRKMGRFVIPFLCAYVMLIPVMLGKSMQFSSCFYALAIGSLVLLLLKDQTREKYAFLVFFYIGVFTAYFDLLTYPIAAFGVPAVFYMALQYRDSLKEKIGDIVKVGISWCLGFGGMWGSKWVAAYLLTGHNTFSEAAGAFSLRVSNTGEAGVSVSKIGGVLLNYRTFLFTPIVIICLIVVIYYVIMIGRAKTGDVKISAAVYLPYIILALAPVVWFVFATNHSSIHYWFTNKACVVSVIAILFCLCDICHRVRRKQTPDTR